MFLARVLGILYIINNVDDEDIRSRASVRLIGAAVPFLVLFVAYLVHLLLKDGYAYDESGLISIVPYKYLDNFLTLWPLTILFLIGVVMVLYGTAYYPSTADLQSSLTIVNSCSSEFTLRTMFYVSLIIPFVLAYIVYAWWAIDKKKLDKQEIADDHAY